MFKILIYMGMSLVKSLMFKVLIHGTSLAKHLWVAGRVDDLLDCSLTTLPASTTHNDQDDDDDDDYADDDDDDDDEDEGEDDDDYAACCDTPR